MKHQNRRCSFQVFVLGDIQAARAEDGSFLIAYVPTGKPLSIQLEKLSGKEVKAHWYDPRQGTWHGLGEFANTGLREFRAPSQGPKEDWVLVLDAVP